MVIFHISSLPSLSPSLETFPKSAYSIEGCHNFPIARWQALTQAAHFDFLGGEVAWQKKINGKKIYKIQPLLCLCMAFTSYISFSRRGKKIM